MSIVRPLFTFLVLFVLPLPYTWASLVEAQDVIWRPITHEDIYLDGKELSYLSEEMNLEAGGLGDGVWLELLPGGEIAVLVPASHWLDVVGLSTSLSESVALQASETPGLFYAISGQYVSDSRLVVRPADRSRFVVIKNVLGATQGIRLQLGASPKSKPPLLSYKAPDTPFGNGLSRLTRQPDARKLPLVRLEADAVNQYKISGPALLTISSIAPGVSVGSGQLVWNIEAQLDGKALTAWGHRASVDNRQYYRFSGQEFWATTPKQYYLQIPDGEHVLSLRPNKAIWLSVGDNSSNFLFAKNKEFLPPYVQSAPDLDKQNDLQFANRLLNNSDWTKKTGSSVNSLRAKLGDKQAAAAISDLGGSSYRAIYPNAVARLNAVNLDSLPREWRPMGDMKPRYVDAEEQNLLYPKRKSMLFFELSGKRDLTFKLPSERILPQVKICIYNPKKLGETISVRGMQRPLSVVMAPGRYYDWPWKYSGSAALPYLRDLQESQVSEHKGNLAQGQGSVSASHSEMVLDIDDGTGQLIFSSNADEPLYITLSVSTPISPGTEEQQWLGLFGGESKMNWLTGDISSVAPAFRDEVSELRELLNFRDQQFRKGLNIKDEFPANNTEDGEWLAQAKALQATSRGGKLAELVFVEQNGSSLELWKWRLDLLRNNSLWGTYLRLLKGLSAQTTNMLVQHYAQRTLTEYLAGTEDDLALENLSAHLILGSLDPAHLYTFAEQRFHAGDYPSALRSLALLPQTDKSAQLGLWTAIQVQQWRLYEHLLNFVDAENRDFYKGLQALFAGDNEAVNNLWGLEKQKQARVSIVKYLQQTSFPSVNIPQTPRPSRLTVISAPELFNVWNPLRQTYNMQYQVTPELGLKTSITGPAEVLLDVRQLKTRSDDRSDDWVKIQLDDRYYLMPINGSDRVSTLTIKNYAKLMGGTRSARFNIGPGQHQISIAPQHAPMAIDVKVRASAMPDLISARGAGDCQLLSQWQLVDGSSLSDTCITALGDQDLPAGSAATVNTSSITPLKVFNSHPDVQVLTRQIWQWEQNGKREDKSLQDIATALIRHAGDGEYRILKQRMSKYYGFELLNPTQSAGRKVIEALALPIESPVARLAAAAKGYQAEKGTLYSPGDQVKFALQLPSAIQAQLLVTRHASAFTYIPETRIKVLQDGKTLVEKPLQGSKTSEVDLSLDAGNHDLSVSFNNGNFDQLFTVDLMIADGQGGWRQGAPLQRRRLNTASDQSPLKYYLPRATLLRIDEYDREGNVRSYHHMQDEAGFYTLNASDKDDKAFRVFKLKRRDKIVLPSYVPETNAGSEANSLASAEPVRMLKPGKPVLNLAEYQGGIDHGGDSVADNRGNTWGLYYRGQSRLNFDEGDSAAKERFHEFGAQQRDYDRQTGRYRRFDILSRFHESGEIVLGAKAYIDWRTKQPGQMLYSKMSAYYQVADGAQSSAWSGRADFGWQQSSTLSDTIRNKLDLSGFYLRVGDQGSDGQSWDNDVYSAFKKDHENGLKLSNTLRYQPFKDIELFSRFSARSNPLNQHFDGDSASLNLGAQAYLEGSVLNAKFERYRFFADDDRSRQSDKDVWTVGVQHNLWRSQGAHWRVKALVAYDDTNDESTVNFGIGWNDTQGRGISDFRLNEFPFRDLYDLQAEQQMSSDAIQAK